MLSVNMYLSLQETLQHISYGYFLVTTNKAKGLILEYRKVNL